MNEQKFRKGVVTVVEMLYAFYTMTDKSDKRIVRDTIRAFVKELTRV